MSNTPKPHKVHLHIAVLDQEHEPIVWADVVLDGNEAVVSHSEISDIPIHVLEDMRQALNALNLLLWRDMRRRRETWEASETDDQLPLPFR